MNKYLKLFIAIVICESAGLIGTIFTMSEIPNWYAGLVKPALNPPSWIFGPVWTMLYLLMGIALFLIWNTGIKRHDVRKAIGIFALQLILNSIWSIVFFGLHSTGWAFVNLVAIWLAIIWTIMLFNKISKPAARLLIPYILWVSFAGYLNFMIWILN